MSDTRQRILDDIKTAMRSGDKPRLATLRLISAALKQREVDERVVPDEQATLAVLDRLMKQRRESIAQYARAGRDDLVAGEEAEAAIIGAYLPAALGQAEIDAMIERAVIETGAASVKDMGRVMSELRPRLQGRADIGAVSRQVRERLGA